MSGIVNDKRPLPRRPIKRWGLLVLACTLFVATRVYILIWFEPLWSDVPDVYWTYAIGIVDLHALPYADNFPIEYPPLAVWAICLPRMLDHIPIPEKPDFQQVQRINDSFHAAFRYEMFLCDIVSFAILLVIVQERRPKWLGWIALLYVGVTTALAHTLYDRLDVGLLMLIMLWAFAWTRTIDKQEIGFFWSTIAYFVLGLAISYKLVPVIVVPFLLVADYQTPRRRWFLSLGIAACAIGAAGPFLMQQIFSGPGVYALFAYHGGRGIQLESFYSSLMLIGSIAGWPTFISPSHGAFDLSGELAAAMKALSIAVQFIFLLALGFWSLMLGRRVFASRSVLYCTLDFGG